ncbi:WcbI family polysaccharide biosynthesis putative acetyltransferase [Williamsia herbipolensis]|uniref:WcbI family polysaccharide biosynthesis putative acetyltransferase n=1 Tax=Williamsia herbipolensis TaxID=1603258 RepID=UPI0005F7B279|nr:WcbI family polysaccharide biosynthesis putative acetyltransferase [Williamsia herbipolensis]
MTNEHDPRTIHYGDFYGVSQAPGPEDPRPLWVVWGNCQAEALRVLLDTVADRAFVTCRVPPVHELTGDDIPHVQALLARARVVLSQPVRSGYRDLPIGTDDLTRWLPTDAVRLRWPVIRYGGLYPFQVIVRDPAAPSVSPPVVPYHDLRTLFGRDDVEVTPEQIRTAARWSVEQLAAREARHCDVGVSDTLLGLGAAAAHTVNHPGNPVLATVATRLLSAAGHPGTPGDPGRTLLGGVRSPLEERVIEALGLDAAPRETWTVEGRSVTSAHVHAEQAAFYAEHLTYIESARTRYAELLEILGMAA